MSFVSFPASRAAPAECPLSDRLTETLKVTEEAVVRASTECIKCFY